MPDEAPSIPGLIWSACITGYFIMWCITIVRYQVAGSRLIEHLRHSYKDRWRYLTSIGNFHSGQVNQLRTWRYMRSDEDEGHPRVRELKNAVRKRGRQVWIVFLGGLPILCLLGGLLSLWPSP